jgi:hypothetical protein
MREVLPEAQRTGGRRIDYGAEFFASSYLLARSVLGRLKDFFKGTRAKKPRRFSEAADWKIVRLPAMPRAPRQGSPKPELIFLAAFYLCDGLAGGKVSVCPALPTRLQ